MELDSAGPARRSTGRFVAFPQHPAETEAATVFSNLQTTGTVTGVIDIEDSTEKVSAQLTTGPSLRGQ
eukprot:9441960-Prorocentrum_lima.AAC.1